jgi:hypothetical protein
MVTLYVGGQKLSWAEAVRLVASVSGAEAVEARDDTGRVLASSVPPGDDDPDWVKAITPEETARRMAGEFVTFEEMKKRLGWE